MLNSQPQFAYGLYITLDAPNGLFIEEWRKRLEENPPTEKSVDVRIRYQDKTLDLTFEEFLEKLGLLEHS